MNDLADYADSILDFCDDRSRRGHCDCPTHAAERTNPACGDRMHVELRLSPAGQCGNPAMPAQPVMIEQFRFTADGCCLSQAGAAALAEYLEGSPVEVLESLDLPAVVTQLAGGAAISPARQNCWGLALRAAKAALASPLAGSKKGSNAAESEPAA